MPSPNSPKEKLFMEGISTEEKYIITSSTKKLRSIITFLKLLTLLWGVVSKYNQNRHKDPPQWLKFPPWEPFLSIKEESFESTY